MAIPYGKYLLDHKLTEGGMAEIFLARPNPMLATPELLARRGPIVVKRLFAHHSAEGEFVRMFFNEARLAARIKHPHIVDIFDQGESDGTYFLAMEYIPGEDLRGIAQQSDTVGKRPPLAVLCRIIMDTLAGLHYAHTLADEQGLPLGLVHRDVSPQNVLVTYDGVVKLIDFGIAKATRAHNSEQTQAGMIKGKYAYMSPEQTRGEQLDARSDIFSAGTLLWELLTWRRLFKRATDLATLVAVTEEPAPSMRAINSDIPQELDDITLRALAPSRNDRWSSAKEFHDALHAFVKKAGWDASCEALGQYMKEIFADKLAALARESTPLVVDEKPSAGLPIGHRIPRLPGQAPGASSDRLINSSGRRPLSITMPLQTLSPALAQQARKLAASPKSATSLPGTGPGPVPPPTPSSRSESLRRSQPTVANPPSMPMRIVPDGSNALKPPPATPSLPPEYIAPLPLFPIPRDAAASGTEIVQAPLPQVVPVPVSQPEILPPWARHRVLWAVLIGVIIGVLAVLALQLLDGRPSQ